ncbi:MAG: rhomboid family intramembrane serine protease [Acidobacteriales bacterium]|nr:rhomboid family intramembrane serine protease [Terriglobales bacterium]
MNCRTETARAIAGRRQQSPPLAQRMRSWPPLTTALVAINVLVYVAMIATGVSPMQPTIPQLLQWGADFGPLTLNGEFWRMLTSNYVHIGLIHIGLNMWCLWNLGMLAERIFDPWTYIVVYTACGLAGSLNSLFWHPVGVGAGASGAIFGLAGALIAALYLGHLPVSRQAMQGTLRSLLTFAGYNLLFGAIGSGIDNSAHIGGLVAGLATGAALSHHLTSGPGVRRTWRTYIAVATVLLMILGTSYLRKHNQLPPLPKDFLQPDH